MSSKEDPPKRRAKRIGDKSGRKRPTNWATASVALDPETHQRMSMAAEKFGHSNTKYVSACVRHFTEMGLDPTLPRLSYLDGLAVKMSEVNQDVRQHNAGIGNRLVEIMRAWEKQLYQQLALIQASHIKHLEQVEANLLNHLVQMQRQALAPMLEEMLRYGLDAHIARQWTERIFLLVTGPSFVVTEQVKAEFRKQHDASDTARDTQLTKLLRELLEQYSVPQPFLSKAPTLAPPPQPAARKPAPSTTPTAPAAAPAAPAPTSKPTPR